MFDIGFSEILLVAVAALIAIGPKDLPEMLFKFGRFMRQVRIFVGDIRNQYSDIMHEAEVNHYRKQLEIEEKPPEKMPEKVIDHD
jgi:sec-independent protein translocase protein TatB